VLGKSVTALGYAQAKNAAGKKVSANNACIGHQAHHLFSLLQVSSFRAALAASSAG
jgi:hypothetical protein